MENNMCLLTNYDFVLSIYTKSTDTRVTSDYKWVVQIIHVHSIHCFNLFESIFLATLIDNFNNQELHFQVRLPLKDYFMKYTNDNFNSHV